MMLIDAFQPEGITRLAVDSIFMMPHLGVVATVHPEAAMQVFWRDCLVPLGVCVAPRGQGQWGKPCFSILVETTGASERHNLAVGELRRLTLAPGQTARLTVDPARGFDCGAGSGRRVTAEVTGGWAGIILDARCRPLQWPENAQARLAAVRSWIEALDAYPAVAVRPQ